MFKTLRLQSSLEDVGKGLSKRANVLYHRAACIHCKRKKLRCSGDRPTCERCQSKKIECAYPARKSASPTKRNASTAFKGTRASNQPNSSPEPANKVQTTETSNAEERASVSSTSLEDPLRSLSSGEQIGHGEAFQSIVEDQPIYMFTSLFEDSPDLSMEDSEQLMLLEPSSSHFDLESDTVPALIHGHDSDKASSASDPYDFETCFSPTAAPELSCTSWCQDSDLHTSPEAEKIIQMPGSVVPRCQCVKQTITALEDTLSWTEVVAPSVAESTLAAHKKTLANYETLLRCKRCCSSTSATIMALMISDQLITCLQRLHVACGSWIGEPPQYQTGEEMPMLLGCDELSARRISIGGYQVDSRKEWARIIDVLISLQLTRLSKVLARVRSRIESSSSAEDFQAQVVQQQEARLRDTITHFERSARFSVF
ncbi:hypothetical protein MPH_12528 [Macrophomina phaseolina MS6]|uniref:Zn(2)-C6 fungal-type domain-containing protein n=2 Tax=Macrophomina phaseolina TaxID=35725 RepID=K2RJW7_MACPH|nr:hypothetical protein MPH_12528 [Macrophomina phaseolina MS6]KAH7014662.1 hypothetical protein B0J12DRAFT_441805 [Macrophomina phaseolina]